MKHKPLSLFVSIFLLSAVVVPIPAMAVDVFPVCSTATGGSTDVCKDVTNQRSSGQNPIISVIKDIIEIISIAIGVAAVIVIIISGLRFVLNGDDPKAVEQARSGIIYALAGIAVALTAQAIVVFVLNKL
jgi:hypothetical protein